MIFGYLKGGDKRLELGIVAYVSQNQVLVTSYQLLVISEARPHY